MSKIQFRKILSLLSITLLSIFILDKLAYLALNSIGNQVMSGESMGKINHYLKIKDSLNVIVLGNSRAYFHVDPSVIDSNSYNVGLMRRSVAYSNALVGVLPAKKKQTVLVQLDLYNAFDPNYSGEDLDVLNVHFYNNSIIQKHIKKLNQANPLQYYLWCITYNGKVISSLKNYFKPKYDYKNYLGYDPLPPKNTQELMENKEFETQDQRCINSRLTLNSIYVNSLIEIRDFALKNNKQLFFFTSPRYNDVCQLDNQKMDSCLKSLNCIYLDHTNSTILNASTKFWNDRSHLNKIGADIYSQQLKLSIELHTSR
ncbi:MAG: hypothetical protein KDC83_03575 [Flavobacteriales bacterium]|nr:hypothetical protein [Flavobacteriales bacterium]